MKIAVGSDHAGYHLKNQLRDMLRAEGHAVTDVGADSLESSDYPDYAARVARAVAGGEAERGVLVCGTGVGMAIAANKVHGVRAAACTDPVTAGLSRAHNDANVVCIGERIVGPEIASAIIRAFMGTPFSQGERHLRRIGKIHSLEENVEEVVEGCAT